MAYWNTILSSAINSSERVQRFAASMLFSKVYHQVDQVDMNSSEIVDKTGSASSSTRAWLPWVFHMFMMAIYAVGLFNLYFMDTQNCSPCFSGSFYQYSGFISHPIGI